MILSRRHIFCLSILFLYLPYLSSQTNERWIKPVENKGVPNPSKYFQRCQGRRPKQRSRRRVQIQTVMACVLIFACSLSLLIPSNTDLQNPKSREIRRNQPQKTRGRNGRNGHGDGRRGGEDEIPQRKHIPQKRENGIKRGETQPNNQRDLILPKSDASRPPPPRYENDTKAGLVIAAADAAVRGTQRPPPPPSSD